MSYTPNHGDIFALKDREQLGLGLNGSIKTFTPNQWYTVLSGTIPKGTCVSIDNDGSSEGKLVVTNADNTGRAVGLTLNDTINGRNEVQSYGLYDFGSVVFSTSDIGKTVYVADAGFTTDKVQASAESSNLIELGIVVSLSSLFIDIEGDTRDGIVTTIRPFEAGEAIATDGSPKLVSIGDDGKAYLADKRRSLHTIPENRNNVYGFIIGATDGYSFTIPAGETVIVQTAGLMAGTFGLAGSVGKALFLAENGTWTANTNGYIHNTDVYVPVGVAVSENEIYVRLSAPATPNIYYPIGTMIKQGGPTPDYGWLTCDHTEALKADYPELYDRIGDEYGTASDPDYFVLPPSGSVTLQIKYLNWYVDTPTETPMFRYDSGLLPYGVSVPGSVMTIPTNTFGFDPPLTDMFAEVYITNGTITHRIDATVVPFTYAGLDVITESFQCQLYKDTADEVKLRIADGGLAYYDPTYIPTGASEAGGLRPIPTDGSWTFRVFVYKTERFNRYYDYTADVKLAQLWGLGLTNASKNPTDQVPGTFDRGTTDPSDESERLNYDGVLHTTKTVSKVLESTALEGVSPLVVQSTTQVDNLNAELVGGYPATNDILTPGPNAVATRVAIEAYFEAKVGDSIGKKLATTRFTKRVRENRNVFLTHQWPIPTVPVLPATKEGFNGILYVPEMSRYIAYKDTALFSIDGIEWDNRETLPFIAKSMVFGNNRLLAVGDSAVTYSIDDGETWLSGTISASNWESVVWAGYHGVFIAVASSGVDRIATSPDGITWTPIVPTFSPSFDITTVGLLSIDTSPLGRVVVGGTGILIETANLTDWTVVTYDPMLAVSIIHVKYFEKFNYFSFITITVADDLLNVSTLPADTVSPPYIVNNIQNIPSSFGYFAWSEELQCVVLTTEGDVYVSTSFSYWYPLQISYPGEIVWSSDLGQFVGVSKTDSYTPILRGLSIEEY